MSTNTSGNSNTFATSRAREQSVLVEHKFQRGQRICVHAPPGCGKTYACIEHARRHFGAHGDKTPSSVLFLTFTNEAVREQRSRLVEIFNSDPDVDDMARRTMCTLHSFGLTIFRILADTTAPLPSPDHVFKEVLGLVDSADPDMLGRVREEIGMPVVECIYGDEAQDMNAEQHMFMRMLADILWPGARIVLVGDPRQSIYAFAGASPELFEAQRDATHIAMNKCFRSTRAIVEFINHIAVDMGHAPIEPGRAEVGTPPFVGRFDGQYSELEWIVREIGKLLRLGYKPSDIAVLSRKHSYTSCELFSQLVLAGYDVCALRDAHAEKISGQSTERITVGTIHASKGDEWKCVFLAGVTDSEFLDEFHGKPDQDRLEEETRILFVGASRAIERLYVTYAANKFASRYGNAADVDVLTRFITAHGPHTSRSGFEPSFSNCPRRLTTANGTTTDAVANHDGKSAIDGESHAEAEPTPIRRICFSPSLNRTYLDCIDDVWRDEGACKACRSLMPPEVCSEPMTIPSQIRLFQSQDDYMLAAYLVLADELYHISSTETRFETIGASVLLPALGYKVRRELELVDVDCARKMAVDALDTGSTAPDACKKAIRRCLSRRTGDEPKRQKRKPDDQWADITGMFPNRDLWRPSREMWDWSLGDGLAEELVRDMTRAYYESRHGSAGRRTSTRNLVLMSLLLTIERDDGDCRLLMRLNAHYNGRVGGGVPSLDMLVAAVEECVSGMRALAHTLVSRLSSADSYNIFTNSVSSSNKTGELTIGDIDEHRVQITNILTYTPNLQNGSFVPVSLGLAQINGVNIFTSTSDSLSIAVYEDCDQEPGISVRTSCVAALAVAECPHIAVVELDTGVLVRTSAPNTLDARNDMREAIKRSYEAWK